MKPNKLLYLSGLLISFLLGWIFSQNYHHQSESNDKSNTVSTASDTRSDNEKAPEYVYEIYEYVMTHDEPPSGYVGGRKFYNRERLLPLSDTYKEWDVLPKVKGKNRGAERLVTSNKGDGYYTRDHYKSFVKIN